MAILYDKVDLHIHTTFSDGRSSVQDMISVGRSKGIKIMAITDHYDEFSNLPKRLTRGQLVTYLIALERVGGLKGVEVDIFEDGSVSISRDIAESLDLVIGGLHVLQGVFFRYDITPILDPKVFAETLRVTLIKAMETGLLDVLAHVTRLSENLRSQKGSLVTKEWIRSIIKAACDNRVAIEISGSWKIPDEAFIRECVHQGAMLSVGSDAHSAKMVGNVEYSYKMIIKAGGSGDSLFIPKIY